jgi:hypothetical protein
MGYRAYGRCLSGDMWLPKRRAMRVSAGWICRHWQSKSAALHACCPYAFAILGLQP